MTSESSPTTQKYNRQVLYNSYIWRNVSVIIWQMRVRASYQDASWKKTWKIYLCLSQEHKFPREGERMMQADENDAKAPALRVIPS